MDLLAAFVTTPRFDLHFTQEHAHARTYARTHARTHAHAHTHTHTQYLVDYTVFKICVSSLVFKSGGYILHTCLLALGIKVPTYR